jgi:hypothetical protein
LRTENLLKDLLYALRELIPDRLNDNLLVEKWPWCISLNVRRQWMEGIEQWMRDELYTLEMIEQVYEQDWPIFERFGYSHQQNYYYLGGCGTSCHGTKLGDFKSEKVLSACWAEWGFEPPGPF